MSPEGGVILSLAGLRYGDEPHLDLLLAGHAGDTVRIDRKTNNRNRYPQSDGGDFVVIRQPAITMGVCVQPVVIEDLGRRTVLRRRGRIARFLYCLPGDHLGAREWTTAELPGDALAIWSDAVSGMARRNYINTGSPQTVAFAADARAVIEDFDREIEPRLGPGGNLRDMLDWAGKVVGAPVRL